MDNKEIIVVIGYGWVGQANALALKQSGLDVFYYDIVPPKKHYIKKFARLYDGILTLGHPTEKDSPRTCYLVCVGDRVKEDGEQDISLIKKALKSLEGVKGRVILRSTVLPNLISSLDFDFYLPEFLHEKYAVEEVLMPFYFVVGRKNQSVLEPKFFEVFEKNAKKVFRGRPEEASQIKYLSNIWNAIRIAFTNEFGNLLEEPINEARQKQIEKIIDFVFEGKDYLRYGRSFGGHCLPKDLRAFLTANKDKNTYLLKAAYESNEIQRQLEQKYIHIPQWFSRWEYGASINLKILSRDLLNILKRNRFFMTVRHTFKPIARSVEGIFPSRTIEGTRRLWDKLANENARFYANPRTDDSKDISEFQLRESGLADYNFHVKNDPLFLEYLKPLEQKRILEMGCGVGRMTEFFADDFAEVHGIDISGIMLDSARKRLNQLKNVKLVLNNGAIFPYSDNFFDGAFSYLVFPYISNVSDIEKNLTELYRVMKPKSVAKIQLRTGFGPWRWQWFYGVSFKPETAKAMAEKVGFNVLKTEVEKVKDLWIWLEKK